jgi:hypothetical protein
MDTSDTLDDEMKRQVVGKCCFSILSLFSSAAFICGLFTTTYCDFLNRDIVFAPNFDRQSACLELDYEGTVLEPICDALLSKHGVGFYGWQATVPVDQEVCFSYTQLLPDGTYVTPEFDTKFNSAWAFAITANVFGAFAFFTIALSACCQLEQARLNGMTGYFFLACFFQGLSLLMLKSDICSPGFFAQYFRNSDVEGGVDSIVSDVECSLGTGAKFAITATVLYFVCNNITPLCVVPDTICRRQVTDSVPPPDSVPASAQPPDSASSPLAGVPSMEESA